MNNRTKYDRGAAYEEFARAQFESRRARAEQAKQQLAKTA